MQYNSQIHRSMDSIAYIISKTHSLHLLCINDTFSCEEKIVQFNFNSFWVLLEDAK